MIDLCTKLEISMFTHYEDMKGDKNAEIVVVWGLGVSHRRSWKHNHLIQHIRLPIQL